ncbi:hypothetical protein VTN96DRAFT_3424 [Rasamsonia emersonii]|uniref:PLC-like phosphodiesterase n=1 Tax=Rasamsonia emersonii (strain ATCC 16479 / CBS 393.64 / IMI 116815) TaxID=1408163 RepID=A0A0F4YWS3_RASE3|nr:hypothetical protein T310_3402 [Rasamsonia emersonii CBS 393.64]KKA22555.1 hypothetical protein T310_3402 [Rasamsonia emersonii CBS 393.64]
MLGLRLLPLLLLPFSSASVLAPRSSTACNNSPDLCDKSYGEITHLGAHDSPFLRDSSTSYSTAGNQYYNTTVQLSAGVRLVTAQVHKNNGAWHLCHTSCDLLDAGTLESWLVEIKTWLDNNPNDVVTVLLVNSDNAAASDLNAVFEAAGIVKYAYKPNFTSPPATWPTLQELISAGTRMMTFVASLSSNAGAEYLMDEFTYIFENNYDVTAASNFSCQPNRPSTVENNIAAALSSNRLPFMNHFLDSQEALGIEIPDVSAIDTTNGQSGTGNLQTAATTCKSQYGGRQPTFILVDFFDKGPAIATVDMLNNVTNPVGRSPVPNTNSDDTASSGSSGLAELVSQAKSGANPTLGNWIWVGGRWGSLLGGGVSI